MRARLLGNGQLFNREASKLEEGPRSNRFSVRANLEYWIGGSRSVD